MSEKAKRFFEKPKNEEMNKLDLDENTLCK